MLLISRAIRTRVKVLIFCGLVMCGLGIASPAHAEPQEPGTPASALAADSEDASWLASMPVPADPELEAQIEELQSALTALHKEMVRRKDALGKTQDPARKTQWYEELETLRKERGELEALLHALVEEARISEQTAIDEALARARWLERQQERQQQKEEIIRDRQE